MKAVKAIVAIFSLSLLGSCTVYNTTTYSDGVYGTHPDVVYQEPAPPASNYNNQEEFQDVESYTDENGNTVINNYGELNYGTSYASRINRFRRPAPGLGYYSPYYSGWNVGFGYNNFYGSSFSIGYNAGFYDPFCDPWFSFYDPWYSPWGFGYRAYRPYYHPYFYNP